MVLIALRALDEALAHKRALKKSITRPHPDFCHCKKSTTGNEALSQNTEKPIQ